MTTIAKSFIKDGKRYYIPKTSLYITGSSSAGKEFMCRYKKLIDPLWQPPFYMFNGKKGGHLSAIRKHLNHKYFAVIDLASFYETITDTKIYRALRSIGISRWKAYKLAGDATVATENGFVLARGLHQSNLLASLVFDRSLLGAAIRNYSRDGGCTITVYSDDIIISAWNEDIALQAYASLRASAIKANFRINKAKSQSPSECVEVFNLNVKMDDLEFTETRMEKFYDNMLSFKHHCEIKGKYYWTCLVDLHGEYIYSVCRPQLYELTGRLFIEEHQRDLDP